MRNHLVIPEDVSILDMRLPNCSGAAWELPSHLCGRNLPAHGGHLYSGHEGPETRVNPEFTGQHTTDDPLPLNVTTSFKRLTGHYKTQMGESGATPPAHRVSTATHSGELSREFMRDHGKIKTPISQ